MPLPFEGISGAVARAVFKALVPDWYKAGMSANKMIREFRRLGGAIRRQYALDVIRSVTGKLKLEDKVKSFDPDRIPTRDLFVEVNLNKPRKYRVYADVTLFNEETGEEYTKLMSFYTDSLKPYNLWSIDFENWYNEHKTSPSENYYVVGFDVRSIEHNRGFPY